MTDCRSGSNTYLDYKCYDYLKPRFGTISLSEDRKNDIRKAVSILEQNKNIPSSYETILHEITGRVSNDGVFISADPRIPCNYINYLLNKKLRSNDMHKNNSNYDFFKKFVVELYKIRNGKYHDGRVCDIDIKSLDDDTYDKMTKLYELYDLYNILKRTHSSIINNECINFRKMVGIYNNTIKDLTLQDEELVNKLLTLKEMTSKIPLPDYTICYDRMDHFKKPELYNDLKEQERLKQQEEEEAQKAIEKQKQEEAQRPEEEQQKHQQERETQNSLLSQGTGSTLGIPGDDVLSGTPREHPREKSLKLEFPRRQEHSEGSHFGDPSTPLLGQLMEPKGELDQQEVKYHESEDNRMAQRNTAGVFGTLQDTLSGIVQGVEPAPILGVSGGMGALFLLFKYTPVGSFFGGRRGRIRQIPSSFRGFPPGEFPNFHEYDGGFIGYGPMNINPLAE